VNEGVEVLAQERMGRKRPAPMAALKGLEDEVDQLGRRKGKAGGSLDTEPEVIDEKHARSSSRGAKSCPTSISGCRRGLTSHDSRGDRVTRGAFKMRA